MVPNAKVSPLIHSRKARSNLPDFAGPDPDGKKNPKAQASVFADQDYLT